jgi:hypothetical protein
LWNEFVAHAKNATFLFHRDFMEYHSDRFEDYSLLIFDGKDNKVAWFITVPGKMDLLSTYTYNENNKLTFIQTTKNGKVKHKENYTYNDQGRISKSEITNLKKNKRYEMTYEYYDGKKLKFQQFRVNGKVKKTWSTHLVRTCSKGG